MDAVDNELEALHRHASYVPSTGEVATPVLGAPLDAPAEVPQEETQHPQLEDVATDDSAEPAHPVARRRKQAAPVQKHSSLA